MSVTTIQEKYAASGARLGSYRGAETPNSFGDTAAEFRALLEGCAIFDMSWQAKLVLSGEDRVRWLNGMVTNNVRDLAPGRGVYSFLLSAQGRIQGDLLAYNRADYLSGHDRTRTSARHRSHLRPLHHHGRRRGRRHQRQAGNHRNCRAKGTPRCCPVLASTLRNSSLVR